METPHEAAENDVENEEQGGDLPVGEDAEGDGEAEVADGGEEGRIRVAWLGGVSFEPMAVHPPDVAVEGDAVDEEADGDGDEAVEVDGDVHLGLLAVVEWC